MYRYDSDSKRIVFSLTATEVPVILSSGDILNHLNRMYYMLDACASVYQQLEDIFGPLSNKIVEIPDDIMDDDIKVGGTDE
jgi:hypothetical protein